MASEYDRGTVCGLVLLPDEATSSQLIAASAELAALCPSQVILGATNSLPHISVIHLRLTPGDHEALWGELLTQMHQEYSAETTALYLKPHDDRVWVGVEVRKTSALTALHTEMLTLSLAHNLEVLSEPGDRYWPHITLGRWHSLPSAQPPLHTVINARFRAVPVLAEMGPHGTVERLLERRSAVRHQA